MADFPLSLVEIVKAAERVAPYVHETPLIRSESLRKRLGFSAPVFLKLENLQKTGAFKVRGAANKIVALSQSQKPEHIVAASAGNHAQAVAYVCGQLQIPCTIVMPEGAPLVKVAATQSYGAQVMLKGLVYDEAYEAAQKIMQEKKSSSYVHAYEDLDIVAGQGTLGLELYHQLEKEEIDLDKLQAVIPIGGGGLISGTALALKGKNSNIDIFGVVSEAAPAMAESFLKGTIQPPPATRKKTLAEGLAVKKVSPLTFSFIQKLVTEIAIVDDGLISAAVSFLMERAKILSEGSGAAGVAACMGSLLKKLDKSKPVVFVICGGNMDLNILSLILERGFLRDERWISLRVLVEDKPGQLASLTQTVGALGANVLEVEHDRMGQGIELGYTRIRLLLETKGPVHSEEIKLALTQNKFIWEDFDRKKMG